MFKPIASLEASLTLEGGCCLNPVSQTPFSWKPTVLAWAGGQENQVLVLDVLIPG